MRTHGDQTGESTVRDFYEDSHIQSSSQQVPSVSNGRRALLGSMAALGVGLVGSASAHAALIAPPAETTPSKSLAHPTPRVQKKVIASDSATLVETSEGKLRGFERNGVFIFKGVPYGASTSGAGRFMPPAKPAPWTGVRNALAYGRVCPQQDSAHANMDGENLANSDEDSFLLHRGSSATVPGEDCLRLNVWTPEINGSHKRPVMVFMHGGGFSSGSGHDLLSYDGENLARNHNVVVVNHNHRLNVFGYLNLGAIGGEEFGMSDNVGMLDIVAVLKWVRTNIAAFGGDPGSVTIFGQSGGGGKVTALMAMPAAKGLFHRAIIQSGPFLKALTPDYSQRVAQLLMTELGLSRIQFNQLQTIPVDRLLGAAVEAMKKMPKPRTFFNDGYGWEAAVGWGPTVDGQILPNHPFDPGAPSVSSDVPLITGTNLNESVNGVDRPGAESMTVAEMSQLVAGIFGSSGPAIVAAFKQDYPQASPFQLWAAIATSQWRIPAIAQATRKTSLGAAPAYSYIYSWRTPILDKRPGTFHASEIAFAFDNAEICDHYSTGDPAAIVLSKQMSGAWANFARTGNPNHGGLPNWPAYTVESRATMFFDSPCSVRFDPEGKGLTIIAQS
jgi:para-nitrobenzyl esterase